MGGMDSLARRPESLGSNVFPEARTELRWQESALWPVRRPYPIDVPCPVCGSYARCDFFGRARCPQGHLFGQRAFWSGRATTCWLLLEDVRDGRVAVYPDAPLRWRDDARLVVGQPFVRTVAPPASEARR
jgi:hypothetical protein